MAIIKAVNSRASIANAIRYITKKEKTDKKLISGIHCVPGNAITEMKATKELWHKTEGRQYKHFVQSFPPDEQVTPKQAHQIAYNLVKDRFKGYEVLLATHKDKEHIHTHILVNSVNFENGEKLQWSKQDLKCMKKRSDQLCLEQNLSVCSKGEEITTNSMKKYKALERGIKGTYQSYVLNTVLAVNQAKEKATSRESFLILMREQGYETEWSETHKYITFKDCSGNKVRNRNLTRTFKADYGKESLENEFRTNKERRARTTDVDWRAVERAARDAENRLPEQPGHEITGAIQQKVRAVKERTDRITEPDTERIKRIAGKQRDLRKKYEQSVAEVQQRTERNGHGYYQ